VANLIYSTIVSLDGYVADADGNFDWAAPDEDVHAFVNDLEREVGTYLYGRRMYEVMHVWQTMDGEPGVTRDYAQIWQSADKIVYSTTLDEVSTPRTRLERSFDADAVRDFVAGAHRDVSVGGPHLASAALRAGIVDELHLFQNPVVVGSGNHFLPGGVHLGLGLVDEHRFANGVVYLRYRTRS
jgi:dihydrofolate reductase